MSFAEESITFELEGSLDLPEAVTIAIADSPTRASRRTSSVDALAHPTQAPGHERRSGPPPLQQRSALQPHQQQQQQQQRRQQQQEEQYQGKAAHPVRATASAQPSGLAYYNSHRTSSASSVNILGIEDDEVPAGRAGGGHPAVSASTNTRVDPTAALRFLQALHTLQESRQDSGNDEEEEEEEEAGGGGGGGDDAGPSPSTRSQQPPQHLQRQAQHHELLSERNQARAPLTQHGAAAASAGEGGGGGEAGVHASPRSSITAPASPIRAQVARARLGTDSGRARGAGGRAEEWPGNEEKLEESPLSSTGARNVPVSSRGVRGGHPRRASDVVTSTSGGLGLEDGLVTVSEMTMPGVGGSATHSRVAMAHGRTRSLPALQFSPPRPPPHTRSQSGGAAVVRSLMAAPPSPTAVASLMHDRSPSMDLAGSQSVEELDMPEVEPRGGGSGPGLGWVGKPHTPVGVGHGDGRGMAGAGDGSGGGGGAHTPRQISTPPPAGRTNGMVFPSPTGARPRASARGGSDDRSRAETATDSPSVTPEKRRGGPTIVTAAGTKERRVPPAHAHATSSAAEETGQHARPESGEAGLPRDLTHETGNPRVGRDGDPRRDSESLSRSTTDTRRTKRTRSFLELLRSAFLPRRRHGSTSVGNNSISSSGGVEAAAPRAEKPRKSKSGKHKNEEEEEGGRRRRGKRPSSNDHHHRHADDPNAQEDVPPRVENGLKRLLKSLRRRSSAQAASSTAASAAPPSARDEARLDERKEANARGQPSSAPRAPVAVLAPVVVTTRSPPHFIIEENFLYTDGQSNASEGVGSSGLGSLATPRHRDGSRDSLSRGQSPAARRGVPGRAAGRGTEERLADLPPSLPTTPREAHTPASLHLSRQQQQQQQQAGPGRTGTGVRQTSPAEKGNDSDDVQFFVESDNSVGTRGEAVEGWVLPTPAVTHPTVHVSPSPAPARPHEARARAPHCPTPSESADGTSSHHSVSSAPLPRLSTLAGVDGGCGGRPGRPPVGDPRTRGNAGGESNRASEATCSDEERGRRPERGRGAQRRGERWKAARRGSRGAQPPSAPARHRCSSQGEAKEQDRRERAASVTTPACESEAAAPHSYITAPTPAPRGAVLYLRAQQAANRFHVQAAQAQGRLERRRALMRAARAHAQEVAKRAAAAAARASSVSTAPPSVRPPRGPATSDPADVALRRLEEAEARLGRQLARVNARLGSLPDATTTRTAVRAPPSSPSVPSSSPSAPATTPTAAAAALAASAHPCPRPQRAQGSYAAAVLAALSTRARPPRQRKGFSEREQQVQEEQRRRSSASTMSGGATMRSEGSTPPSAVAAATHPTPTSLTTDRNGTDGSSSAFSGQPRTEEGSRTAAVAPEDAALLMQYMDLLVRRYHRTAVPVSEGGLTERGTGPAHALDKSGERVGGSEPMMSGEGVDIAAETEEAAALEARMAKVRECFIHGTTPSHGSVEESTGTIEDVTEEEVALRHMLAATDALLAERRRQSRAGWLVLTPRVKPPRPPPRARLTTPTPTPADHPLRSLPGAAQPPPPATHAGASAWAPMVSSPTESPCASVAAVAGHHHHHRRSSVPSSVQAVLAYVNGCRSTEAQDRPPAPPPPPFPPVPNAAGAQPSPFPPSNFIKKTAPSPRRTPSPASESDHNTRNAHEDSHSDDHRVCACRTESAGGVVDCQVCMNGGKVERQEGRERVRDAASGVPYAMAGRGASPCEAAPTLLTAAPHEVGRRGGVGEGGGRVSDGEPAVDEAATNTETEEETELQWSESAEGSSAHILPSSSHSGSEGEGGEDALAPHVCDALDGNDALAGMEADDMDSSSSSGSLIEEDGETAPTAAGASPEPEQELELEPTAAPPPPRAREHSPEVAIGVDSVSHEDAPVSPEHANSPADGSAARHRGEMEERSPSPSPSPSPVPVAAPPPATTHRPASERTPAPRGILRVRVPASAEVQSAHESPLLDQNAEMATQSHDRDAGDSSGTDGPPRDGGSESSTVPSTTPRRVRWAENAVQTSSTAARLMTRTSTSTEAAAVVARSPASSGSTASDEFEVHAGQTPPRPEHETCPDDESHHPHPVRTARGEEEEDFIVCTPTATGRTRAAPREHDSDDSRNGGRGQHGAGQEGNPSGECADTHSAAPTAGVALTCAAESPRTPPSPASLARDEAVPLDESPGPRRPPSQPPQSQPQLIPHELASATAASRTTTHASDGSGAPPALTAEALLAHLDELDMRLLSRFPQYFTAVTDDADGSGQGEGHLPALVVKVRRPTFEGPRLSPPPGSALYHRTLAAHTRESRRGSTLLSSDSAGASVGRTARVSGNGQGASSREEHSHTFGWGRVAGSPDSAAGSDSRRRESRTRVSFLDGL